MIVLENGWILVKMMKLDLKKQSQIRITKTAFELAVFAMWNLDFEMY